MKKTKTKIKHREPQHTNTRSTQSHEEQGINETGGSVEGIYSHTGQDTGVTDQVITRERGKHSRTHVGGEAY